MAVRAHLSGGAGGAAGAVAVGTALHPADADLLLAAKGGLLKAQHQAGAQIFSGNRGVGIALAGAPAKSAAKEGGEDVAQVKIFKSGAAAEAASPEVGIDTGVAVLVIALALFRVGEHLVGLVGLFELGLGVFVAGIQVGMVFLGQLAVGLFDFIVRGGAVYAQHLVIVSFLFSHVTHLLVREISKWAMRERAGWRSPRRSFP